ncbi:MFS transporter [uncultured Pseudokineococcus sp.]|uniref:MFS transporter n=1 Tax=uncultured Pseudokineococcus sp. TaxID=1642928 RepID=UPI0026221BAD|nr:MFS transporter [uncultured Pseudokineococcus sp.]
MTEDVEAGRATGATPAASGGPVGEGGRVGSLVATNLLGGVGVASGIAVGSLLVEQLAGTGAAGLGQAVGVLGAAVAAVPLARLAARRGRRWSLPVGYGVACVGTAGVLVGAATASLLLLVAGLALFGVAQAAGLQSRYAAADGVPARRRGRTIAVVVWATTVGSVAGPNLAPAGGRLGEALGLPALAGPYLFSGAAFALAALVVAVAYRARPDAPHAPGAPAPGAPPAAGAPTAPAVTAAGAQAPVVEADARGRPTGRSAVVGARAALRWAAGDPAARAGLLLLATAHGVMVMVMTMTPLSMRHEGASLQVVGLVISVHIAGMYVLSPLFGWLADAWGVRRTAALGVAVLGAATALGLVSALAGGGHALTAAALVLLGLGWSAATISASSLLAATPDPVRLPLQGAADAGMSYAGALAAALAGPVLALGGFEAVNVLGAALLVPAAVVLAAAARGGRAAAHPPARP